LDKSLTFAQFAEKYGFSVESDHNCYVGNIDECGIQ
jgi:hypothetical protein